jgi:BMFP domain-containing protein YqiC
METITINNKAYNLVDLSDTAKQQLTNIQVVDAELAKLQQQAAIYQTARHAYLQALVNEVEAKPAPKKRAVKAKE